MENGDHPRSQLETPEVGVHCISINLDDPSFIQKQQYQQQMPKSQIDEVKQEYDPSDNSQAENDNRKKYADDLQEQQLEQSSDEDNESEKDTAESEELFYDAHDNDHVNGAVAKLEVEPRKNDFRKSSKNFCDESYNRLREIPQCDAIQKLASLKTKIDENLTNHDKLMRARNRMQGTQKSCKLEFVLYCQKCKWFCLGLDHAMNSNNPMTSNVRRDDGTCASCQGRCALSAEHHIVLPHNAGYSSVNFSDEVDVLSTEKENYRRQIEHELSISFPKLKALVKDPNCRSELLNLEEFVDNQVVDK